MALSPWQNLLVITCLLTFKSPLECYLLLFFLRFWFLVVSLTFCGPITTSKRSYPNCPRFCLYCNPTYIFIFKYTLYIFRFPTYTDFFLRWGFHLSQTGLQLVRKPRMALKPWSACLHFPRASVTGMSHHAQLARSFIFRPLVPCIHSFVAAQLPDYHSPMGHRNPAVSLLAGSAAS